MNKLNGISLLIATSVLTAIAAGQAQAAPQLPGVPQHIQITASADAQAKLTWEQVPGANGYRVKRSEKANGVYTLLGSPTETNFTDKKVMNGETYYYEVTAITNTGLESKKSQAMKFAMDAGVAAPSSLTVRTNSKGGVDVAWAKSTGAASYRLQRATSNKGPYTEVAKDLKETKFTDTSVATGSTYYYQVVAIGTAGLESHASTTAIAKTDAINMQAPAAPSFTDGQLHWTAVPGASGYIVLRSTAAQGKFASIGKPVTTTSIADGSAALNETYYYKVKALGGGSESKPSNVSTAVKWTATELDFVAVVNGADDKATVSWQPVPGAKSYEVLRGIGEKGPLTVVAPNLTKTSFVDENVTARETYHYVVKAKRSSGQEFAESAAMPVKIGDQKLSQIKAQIVQASDRGVSLSWSPIASATGYRIIRGLGTKGHKEVISASTAGTSFQDKNIVLGQRYVYSVEAIGSDQKPVGQSGWLKANPTSQK